MLENPPFMDDVPSLKAPIPWDFPAMWLLTKDCQIAIAIIAAPLLGGTTGPTTPRHRYQAAKHMEAGEFFDVGHRFQSTRLAVEGVGKGGMQPLPNDVFLAGFT